MWPPASLQVRAEPQLLPDEDSSSPKLRWRLVAQVASGWEPDICIVNQRLETMAPRSLWHLVHIISSLWPECSRLQNTSGQSLQKCYSSPERNGQLLDLNDRARARRVTCHRCVLSQINSWSRMSKEHANKFKWDNSSLTCAGREWGPSPRSKRKVFTHPAAHKALSSHLGCGWAQASR